MRYSLSIALVVASVAGAGSSGCLLMAADDVPDFRPGTLEFSLGPAAVMFPDDAAYKVGARVGIARSARHNLVAFSDWTQLSSRSSAYDTATPTVEVQILTGGLQYQVAKLRLPAQMVMYAEGGGSYSSILIERGSNSDNDRGSRLAILQGLGVRIPFGREARTGMKLSYRHLGIPSADRRRHVHQISLEFSVFVRPG